MNNQAFLAFNESYRQGFESLEGALFVVWEGDTVIKPRLAGWWYQYNWKYELVPYNETEFYQKNLFGLRTLVEDGRAQFASIPGNHMHLPTEQVDELLIPYLKS